MPIEPGSRLGPYEVSGAIGAGGMGEVYRARDAKLNRDVAIKVLPAMFAADPERLVRFEREAQTLASLNHSNIAQVYGAIDDPPALVMEFVEGEDLAQRLQRGALPADEVMAIARQLAEALEAAHEQGIVHRDLKPANIKIRPDGVVKVLDFGLAKIASVEAGFSRPSGGPAEAGPYHLANSPTFTSPMTQMGVVLGTAAYMAPEQAKGKLVDKRADIWAFGVVLFELLTGRALFARESLAETIGAVVTQDPDFAQLPAETPDTLRVLLERCLQRDPRNRMRDVGEARILLAGPARAAATPAPVGVSRVPWIAAAAATIVAAASLALWSMRPPPAGVERRLDYSIFLPLASGAATTARLSPDGLKVAVATTKGLWVKRLDTQELRLLAEVPQLRQVFWSDDSARIGIATSRELAWTGAEGGSLTTIADIAGLPGPFNPFGGDATWLPGDRILFGTGMTGLMEVSARGGQPVELVAPGAMTEDFHGAASLPSGGVVTVRHDDQDLNSILLLRDNRRTTIHHAPGQTLGMPVYSPTGHLLFPRFDPPFGTWALPFDEKRGTATGEPFLVVPGVGSPSISTDGEVLLISIVDRNAPVRMGLLERGGREVPGIAQALTVPMRLRFVWPDLSPDGTRVMFALNQGGAWRDFRPVSGSA